MARFGAKLLASKLKENEEILLFEYVLIYSTIYIYIVYNSGVVCVVCVETSREFLHSNFLKERYTKW